MYEYGYRGLKTVAQEATKKGNRKEGAIRVEQSCLSAVLQMPMMLLGRGSRAE